MQIRKLLKTQETAFDSCSRCTEAGENLSDRESIVSGVVTRNLRRKENKKAQAKVKKQYGISPQHEFKFSGYGIRSTRYFKFLPGLWIRIRIQSGLWIRIRIRNPDSEKMIHNPGFYRRSC
jgi:hypothetical protein